MSKDISPYSLAVASLLAALYLFNQNSELKQQLSTCQIKFESFKQGVIHAR